MKIRVIFSKRGDMRFISHLDVWRLFQRSSRRADIPVAVTQGFSPRLKIGIDRALKLGVESDREGACWYLAERMDPDSVKERLNRQLPEGIRVLDAKEEQ